MYFVGRWIVIILFLILFKLSHFSAAPSNVRHIPAISVNSDGIGTHKEDYNYQNNIENNSRNENIYKSPINNSLLSILLLGHSSGNSDNNSPYNRMDNHNGNHTYNNANETTVELLNSSFQQQRVESKRNFYYVEPENPKTTTTTTTASRQLTASVENVDAPTTPPHYADAESTKKLASVAESVGADAGSLRSQHYGTSTTVKPLTNEAEINSHDGDSWQALISNSDIESFLLKYKSDDGRKCLMDDIRSVFLWWAFENGTLNKDDLSGRTQDNCLDFSNQNISDDNFLYNQTKSRTRLKTRKYIAYSAAFNQLTHVPYKTLTLMNGTLKFLTLRGNKFAAYSSEKQKDALNNIFNETYRHDVIMAQNKSNNNTNNTTYNVDFNNTETFYNVNPFYYGRQLYEKLIQKEEGIAWATFPEMPELLELDVSSCQIEFITSDAFRNLTNLRRLFLSHNKMLNIPSDTFQHVPHLQYLDLSFTNAFDFDYQIPLRTLEAIIHLVYGVKIQPHTFRNLHELEFLDMSHTKITRNSAMAFTHLGEKLKYLSLCYTGFPMVGHALFKNTALIGLDLSGNPYAAYNMIDDAFESIADTLHYLYFEQSNLKDLNWLKYLVNLRVLGLAGNNINSVSAETFGALKRLQVLDLSSNHVGNWYNRAFNQNSQLRVLNVRDNNINIINLAMLEDFQLLEYLSLGDNDFVCDCLLRDLIDMAAANNQEAKCSPGLLQTAQKVLHNGTQAVNSRLSANSRQMLRVAADQIRDELDSAGHALITNAIEKRLKAQLPVSRSNLGRYNLEKHRVRMRFLPRLYKLGLSEAVSCTPPSPVYSDRLNGSFKFQLLDYEEEHYWCFNETERMNFVQLQCQMRAYDDNLAQQLQSLTKYVVASVCSVLGATLLGVVIYLKRWHIHYYYSSLKSAALVSVASKETVNKFNELAEHDPNLVYDIFISYCQNDREWVLQELLPNVEEADNLSICLHERDFQIGVTILDNIISCMDRSRALMLIISSNFLLSHWCQFEMHLAQHRIFEVSKEHLIIVFLEDIPRSKRPKTLQYLMGVKTYIKWPGAKGNKVKPEERKLFWKRLKRSLEQIGVAPTESHA